ncbi:hypothetical protein BM1_00449 [Bipolaris maydis]|nr:hypothetical protein BM1_00449 [Bipolaris maydis]
MTTRDGATSAGRVDGFVDRVSRRPTGLPAWGWQSMDGQYCAGWVDGCGLDTSVREQIGISTPQKQNGGLDTGETGAGQPGGQLGRPLLANPMATVASAGT